MDDPIQEAIARRAYELFEARGGGPGSDWADWFAAEGELRREMRPSSVEVHRRDLQPNEVPDAFARSAFAFLDASEALNRNILAGEWPPSNDQGNVVLWLAFHASELFCKACIARLQPGSSVTGHSLAKLMEKLEAAAPGTNFQPPFEVTVLPGGTRARELRSQEHLKIHERLRYPIDKSGLPWGGVSAFLPELFAADLESLRAAMRESYLRIFGAEPAFGDGS